MTADVETLDLIALKSPTPPAKVEPMPAFTHRQIMRVLSGILLCMLLAALDQTAVVPAVPAIAADLNGFGHLAWIVSAYLLTSTAATPIYGKLSDIHGRRALLLPAIVLFVIASALCGVAQSLPQLIAARALQGLGGAGLMSMAQSAIADVIAPRERGKYQAYMSGVWGVASIAGPIVGGWLTDHLSWRWIFWINLPIGLVAFVLSSRALKLLKVRRQQTRIDYVGAAMLAGLVTACLLMMSWGGMAYAWFVRPDRGTRRCRGGVVAIARSPGASFRRTAAAAAAVRQRRVQPRRAGRLPDLGVHVRLHLPVAAVLPAHPRRRRRRVGHADRATAGSQRGRRLSRRAAPAGRGGSSRSCSVDWCWR